MRFKFKRVACGLLAGMIILGSIPFEALAFSETKTSNGYITKSDDNSNMAKAIIEDMKDNKSSSTLLEGCSNLFINNPDYVGLTELPDSVSIKELNESLKDTGLCYVHKNAQSVVVNYSDQKTSGYIVLTTPSYYSISNRKASFEELMDKYAKGYSNKLDSLSTYIFSYYDKDSSTQKYILRFQSATSGILPGFDDDNGVINIEFDLTDMLSNIVKYNEDLSEYPIVKYLVNIYKEDSKGVLEDKAKEQKDVFDAYKKYSASGINFDYKSFWIGFNSNVIGDTKTKPTLKDHSDNSKVGIVSSMYFYALQHAGVLEFDTKDIASDFLLNIDGTYPGSTGSSGFDKLAVIKEGNNIADKYNRKSPQFSNADKESNASMFNDLIRYKYGILSGAGKRTIGSSAADQYISVATLDNLLLSKEKLTDKCIINPALWEQISSMKQFQFEVNISQLMDAMTMVQYLEYYAKDETLSGIKASDSYKNNDLEEELVKLESEAKDNNSDTLPPLENSKLIRQVKAYMQIKEGLDYIGIKPWTKELEYICGDIYNRISKLPLSENFDGTDNPNEPLGRFFSVENETLSANYLTGVALSSTYIPMKTNLYDPKSIRVLNNQNWLRDFHIRYGFYRKALMIDTNVNAAVDGFITDSRDTLRIATLNDLLQTEKDIVLYVDDNFYNTDKVAEMTRKAYDRLSNTEQAGMGDESFDGFFDNLFSSNIEDLLKTGPSNVYDKDLIDSVKQYGKEDAWSWSSITESLFSDGLIFSSGRGKQTENEIDKGLNQRDYSVKQPYALVSGIYRHKQLANELNSIAKRPAPVFISSPALFNMNGISEYEFNSIYNYYMLKNLEASMGVDYRTTLDIDNPLYIDIYGNILTESGLVVIPAASNATLYPNNTYTPYTLGFMDLYSNGVNIPVKRGWERDDENGDNFTEFLTEFFVDDDTKTYIQKNYEFDGVPVNPQRPSISDEALLEKLYAKQVEILNGKGYDFDQRIWLITEVMRGAPMEDINKTKEGISGKRDINKYGLYMSWKLDEIADSILPTTNGNSLISMPNLAFMDGIEYVVLFTFKAMLLLFVLYILYRVYIDAVGGKLGIRTLWNCVSTIVVFCICIAMIPNVIGLSYNEPNKIFLQDEIKYINLLNSEKNLEGREISAVGVEEPKSQTELYLKIDSIKVPWYKVLREVMFAPVGVTLRDIYDDELMSNMLYGYEDVRVVNDGVYISVNDLFDSSNVVYNVDSKFLYQYINSTPTASYFIPYYYIMDNMLSSINMYNTENGIINISTKIQFDGSVKTMGMIGDYLLSEYFMLEDEDPLGLYELYGINTNEQKDFINVTDDSLSDVKESMWYVGEYYKEDDIASRIDQLYSHMRSYVAQNKEMIGRVTDETFIKTMMLDLSMEYNQIFKIPAARGVEVFGIDSRDIIRLSITDKNEAVVNSAYSFGRFVYEEAGSLGVILTSILMGIMFVTSVVKPALVIFLCVLLIYNVLVKSMISMNRGKTVEGLLYVLSILVIVNSMYALFIKLSMMLPELGLNPALSTIGQVVIQVAYLYLVFKLVMAIFRDYANMGYNIFHTAALAALGGVVGTASRVSGKAFYSDEQQSYMASAKLKSESSGTRNANDLREEMDRRDKRRDDAEEETAFMESIFTKDKDNLRKDK